MSSLVRHAKAELRLAGMFSPDSDYDGEIAPVVVALMETFTAYGHSGNSAKMTLDLFYMLAQGLPITPLTGDESEWEDRSSVSGYPIWQNKRCSSVFKDLNGPYRVDSDSNRRTEISFPCQP
jgi:hypothetical protein